MNELSSNEDYTGAFAEAFFIGNLLFIGFFYIALWGLYLSAYEKTTSINKKHLQQTLAASSVTTLIVILLNIFIILTSGYASATALIVAEVYLMVLVPIFLFLGIWGFVKAINHQDYSYPLISKYVDFKG